MLGTNDAKFNNWNELGYQKAASKMIETLLSKFGQVYICTPPPIYKYSDMWIQDVVNTELPSIVERLGMTYNVQVIDVFRAMGGAELRRPDLFAADGVHPNDLGYEQIA